VDIKTSKDFKTTANLADVEADLRNSNTIDRLNKKIVSNNDPQGITKAEILMKNQESTGVVTEEIEVDLIEGVENSEADTEDAEISKCVEEVAATTHLEADVVVHAENSEVVSEANQEEATTMIISRIKIPIVVSKTLNKLLTSKTMIETNQTMIQTYTFES
jgi:hypothetical protein